METYQKRHRRLYADFTVGKQELEKILKILKSEISSIHLLLGNEFPKCLEKIEFKGIGVKDFVWFKLQKSIDSLIRYKLRNCVDEMELYFLRLQKLQAEYFDVVRHEENMKEVSQMKELEDIMNRIGDLGVLTYRCKMAFESIKAKSNILTGEDAFELISNIDQVLRDICRQEQFPDS
eukprot:snap_masked-scaffold_15-processed-gene-5.6-mRNA-1 protein AED:1.00 eAED:1.00 QI:0/-1/0/0/-1/1/1/0/177